MWPNLHQWDTSLSLLIGSWETFLFFVKEDVLPGAVAAFDDNEEMNLWIDVNTEIADQKKRTWVPSVIENI